MAAHADPPTPPTPCRNRVAGARVALAAALASLGSLALVPTARAQAQDDAALLDRVQVTATRTPRALARTPAAVTVVTGDALRGSGPGSTLGEALAGVPGLLARDRQNQAQDEQVSIRGFGTRAAFGIRSVRVYVDGLPATLPDGQGQVSHVPLAGLVRAEVLRGPFAALHGNGAGGVLQLSTADGGAPGQLTGELVLGAFGLRRLSTTATGEAAGWAYSTAATVLHSDGFRTHSRARRDVLHGKASHAFAGGRLTLVANAFDAPDVQDPQGLTAAQRDADPRQASPAALAFGTRKSARQLQLGAIYEGDAGAGALRLLAYGGERRVEQVLGTPVEAQRSPLSAGGWVDLRTPLAGVDARWSWRGEARGRRLEFVAGLAADAQRQARRGFENFAGDARGVRGRLRQDQQDTVRTFDPYVQAHWDLAPDWTLSAGLRHSDVRFRSADRYVAAGNPDDSGAVRYRGSSPVLGLGTRLAPGFWMHAAWGRGFETPTFNELAYRSDGATGPHYALRPMRTRSAELGLRVDRGPVEAELTLFEARTRDELAVNASVGGRTSFRGVGRSRRRGAEGALRMTFGDRWQARLGGTVLEATYLDDFPACTGPGCRTPDAIVAAGGRMPAVPRTQADAMLRWGGESGWHLRVDARHVGGVTVDTAGTAYAAGHVVYGAGAGYRVRGERVDARVWLGIGNAFDRAHVGAVIVNEASQRYFEPGPGRTWTLGASLRW